MEERIYYVYILTNWNNFLLYVGVTNNLIRRVFEHKSKLIPGFTSKYHLDKLVWFESTNGVLAAIAQEKTIERMAARKEKSSDSDHESRLGGFISQF